jgi:transposase
MMARGYETLVVDPASIPVERKSRRAKTDRLDAIRLVVTLRAWLRGEWDRMKVVRVLSLALFRDSPAVLSRSMSPRSVVTR